MSDKLSDDHAVTTRTHVDHPGSCDQREHHARTGQILVINAWGSRGRRFKSCRPDGVVPTARKAVSPGRALIHFGESGPCVVFGADRLTIRRRHRSMRSRRPRRGVAVLAFQLAPPGHLQPDERNARHDPPPPVIPQAGTSGVRTGTAVPGPVHGCTGVGPGGPACGSIDFKSISEADRQGHACALSTSRSADYPAQCRRRLKTGSGPLSVIDLASSGCVARGS